VGQNSTAHRHANSQLSIAQCKHCLQRDSQSLTSTAGYNHPPGPCFTGGHHQEPGVQAPAYNLLCPTPQAGITENLVFRHLHEDAEHLYNTTMSLHAVVTQLTDRTKRLARKVSGAVDKWMGSRVPASAGIQDPTSCTAYTQATNCRRPRPKAGAAAGFVSALSLHEFPTTCLPSLMLWAPCHCAGPDAGAACAADAGGGGQQC
jgi:hypothetical protein